MATINDGLRKLLVIFGNNDEAVATLKTRPELVNAFLIEFVTSRIDDPDISETMTSTVTAQKTIGGKFNALADAMEVGPNPNPSGGSHDDEDEPM